MCFLASKDKLYIHLPQALVSRKSHCELYLIGGIGRFLLHQMEVEPAAEASGHQGAGVAALGAEGRRVCCPHRQHQEGADAEVFLYLSSHRFLINNCLTSPSLCL